MSYLMDRFKGWAVGVVGTGGYFGLVALMILSAANIPIPSEAILPFAGMHAADGTFNVHVVALIATLATSVGSLISYGLGAYLGKDFLLKYGKYIFLRSHEIERGEAWFLKHGLRVTLWGRMIPIVRSFVSLPAGLYRADLKTFLIYSFVGTLPWSYGWTLVGYYLGEHWNAVVANAKWVDLVVIVALLALVGRYVYRRTRKPAVPTES